MKYILALSLFGLLVFSQQVFAANSVISFTDLFYSSYQKIESESANPLLSVLISNNNSNTITLSSVGTSQNPPIYFSLRFNGTGTGCIVRLMNTATKASWVAYPVAAGGVFGQGIHTNTLYINYSSCFN